MSISELGHWAGPDNEGDPAMVSIDEEGYAVVVLNDRIARADYPTPEPGVLSAWTPKEGGEISIYFNGARIAGPPSPVDFRDAAGWGILARHEERQVQTWPLASTT